MNVFLWLFALPLFVSTSHALRVPVSRFKLPNFSPLEKRVQGYGSTSYNVLATTNSSQDTTLVHFLDRVVNDILIQVI